MMMIRQMKITSQREMMGQEGQASQIGKGVRVKRVRGCLVLLCIGRIIKKERVKFRRKGG